MTPIDDALLVRALKFKQCPGVLLAAVEARFGVRGRVLRAEEPRLRAAARWTLDDLIQSGLRDGLAHDVAGISRWVDYLDHAVRPDDVLRHALLLLEQRGAVAREGDRWRLIVEWP